MIKYVTSIFWFMKENNEKRYRFDELKKKAKSQHKFEKISAL